VFKQLEEIVGEKVKVWKVWFPMISKEGLSLRFFKIIFFVRSSVFWFS
jgi:hypothetical protein